MWEFRGIRGGGQPPSYLGKYHGRAIIIGGARCVWDDYSQVKHLPHHTIAVNDIGMYYPWGLEHWVSEHANNLRHWVSLRALHSMNVQMTHTQKHTHDITVCWDFQPYAPFSGLFAAQVAMALGYEEIILCGCPQDGSGHFYDPPWIAGGEHGDKNQLKGFRQMVESMPELRRCTKSMSGWTRELFGEPGTN